MGSANCESHTDPVTGSTWLRRIRIAGFYSLAAANEPRYGISRMPGDWQANGKKSMAEAFKPFDAADYLENEEDINRYFERVEKSGDTRLILVALGDIARARNMSKLARQAGLTRPGLYKALSPEGNPSFETVSKVAEALGLRVSVRAR